MNPVEKLKLSTSTKILLWIGSVAGAILLAVTIDLIQNSNFYAELKKDNPIDAIINMDISIGISSQAILIALIALSLFFNLFLLKRNALYYKAAVQFAKCLYYVGAKYKKATGKPAVFKSSHGEITMGENIPEKKL
ncbi:MAG: hypothetical protein ACPF9K_06120 [Neptuniibacter sp.]